MKNFLGLVMISLSLLLFSGCGGGGGSGTITSVSNSLKYSADSKAIAGSVKMSVDKIVNTSNLTRTIKLSDFSIVAPGCDVLNTIFSPTILNFDSTSSSIQQLNIDIKFNSPCYDTKIELHRIKTIYDTIQGAVQAPKSTLESSSLSVGNAQASNNTITRYALSTATRNLLVSSASDEKNIDLYLYEIKDGLSMPVASKEVLANFVQPIFGTLKSYTAKTNENGKVSFVYDAPQSIKNLSSTKLKFYLKDNSALQIDVNLQFQELNADHVSKIYLVPNSLVIVGGNESRIIKVVTINDNNESISTNMSISSLVDDSGNDYGSFSIQNLKTDANGEGSLTYTSPATINKILDTNKTVIFTVKNSDGTTTQNQLPIIFEKIVADSNASDYEIGLSLDSSSIKIEDSANLTVNIHKKDDNTSIINNNYVYNVTLTSEFPEMLKFNINNTDISSISYVNKAQNSVKLYSYIKAGVAIIKASATIFDGEKNVTIKQDFSYTIMSGPISSLSLVYVDTNYNEGLFRDHYIAHAIDKYGNPANQGEKIYAGVVNGLAISSEDNSTPLSYQNGIISSGDPATFSVSGTNSEFGNIRAQRDRLVILANDYSHDSTYLGGWSIQSINSDTNLTLDKAYTAQSVDNLFFAIGSEDRADTCGGTLALSDLDSQDNSYMIGDDGVAYLTLRYDPYLVGKDVYMYVNAYTVNGRVGTSLRRKLYGTGMTATSKNCTAVGNCTTTLKFTINNRGGEALRNVVVPITYEGSCQIISGKTVKYAALNCDGSIYTEVSSTSTDDTCKIFWDGTIFYDVGAPNTTIYY